MIPLVSWVINIGYALLGISALICIWRMLIGPSILDRILAIDTFSLNILGFMVLWCVDRQSVTLIDPVLALALVGFISTVAMAKYLERGRLID